MTDIFYVYIYLYPNNVPFYIGQGKNKRWKQHFHDKRNPLKKNIIDKIITSGKEPIVKKLFENLYEDEAKIIEKCFMYGKRGKDSLNYGKKASEETKNIMVCSQPKSKKINQYDINYIFIKTFNSIRDAKRKCGIYRYNIVQCCKGKV